MRAPPRTLLVTQKNNGPIYRILDANLNRLREALRVIEEYTRFVQGSAEISIRLKGMRHRLKEVEECIGPRQLLLHRDTENDPFSIENRPEEMGRKGISGVLKANFKRGQEAARVIEEYAKVENLVTCCDIAKSIRFTLYALEKDYSETP